jgi:hypothetical protein
MQGTQESLTEALVHFLEGTMNGDRLEQRLIVMFAYVKDLWCSSNRESKTPSLSTTAGVTRVV